MALHDIPLERIAQVDLQRLIDAGASESLYVDYKRQTYGTSEGEHAEFLADISSFANSAGGDLIIGMAETNGIPTALNAQDRYEFVGWLIEVLIVIGRQLVEL